MGVVGRNGRNEIDTVILMPLRPLLSLLRLTPTLQARRDRSRASGRL